MEVSNGRSVEAVELLTVQLQLERPMETSYGVVSTRPVLLVRVAVADGEGWGECVALEHPSYTSEFHNGAVRVLEDELVPALLRDQPTTPASLKTTLSFVRGHEMAKAALEMALVDLVLSSAGRSLAEHLGVTRSRIAAGANVGLGEASAVVDAVGEAAAAGYRRVKLKISPKADLLLISAVQKAFPTLTLCADANGAYDLDDESHKSALMALDELQLSYLEQPLRPGDLVGHARLSSMLKTPIVLDESIVTMSDLDAAIEAQACAGISVKSARLGGIGAAVEIHDRCLGAGLHLVIGGMYETGLGRSVAISLGALSGFDLAGELGASDRYFAPDLTLPHYLTNGELEVPREPGIGRRPDPAVLNAKVTKRKTLFAP